jgi:hypothetical protein
MDEACTPYVSDVATEALQTILNTIIRPCHTPEQTAWFTVSLKGQIKVLMHDYTFDNPEDLAKFHQVCFSSIYTYNFGGRVPNSPLRSTCTCIG